jgi:hypothetical protein
LLQSGQHRIGADLLSWIAAMIVAAHKRQAGGSDRQNNETAREFPRACIPKAVHHDYPPTRWRFDRAIPTQAVNKRTMTTSAESVRPTGTTAV